jgi:pyrroloquinoline-quinone synthase
MTFISTLNAHLNEIHLLKHPFYQTWDAGSLPMASLKTYAKEYYYHVSAFPRYISNIHALCPDIKERQVLLANLMDEEIGEDNHPELWLRFADGLGVSREECMKKADLPTTLELVDGFLDLAKRDYATGLGALYAYERQTPDVAATKEKGLCEHYGVSDPRALSFFTVHKSMDEKHTADLVSLIEMQDTKLQENIKQGAEKAAQLLWSFLDGMMSTVHAH